MGFVPLSQLDKAYSTIKDGAISFSNQCTLLILVTPDVDSLCALRILTTLLKSDCILHEIIPISGYEDFQLTLDSHLKKNDDHSIKSVVLLNCGAVIQIKDLIPSVKSNENDDDDEEEEENDNYEKNRNIKYYICDAHRPYNLHTLFGEDSLVVFDDGDVNEMDDLKDAYIALEIDSGSDSDSDSDSNSDLESESDTELDIDIDNKEKPLQDINNSNNDNKGNNNLSSSSSSSVDKNGLEDSLNDNQENMQPINSSKQHKKRSLEDEIDRRRAKRMSSYNKKRILQNKKKLISNYYAEGTYFGTSIAAIMYALSLQLGKANSELLWLAIIGTTDQYIHQRIDLKKYVRQVDLFKDEVIRYNIPTRSELNLTNPQGNNELDDLLGMMADSNNNKHGKNERNINTSSNPSNKNNVWGVSGQMSADDSTIVADDEFRLMLLRHWSLYEALYHSDYVATKMGIWKEKGQKRLKRFLVKLGLPHKDSQQLFTEMSASYKRPIKENLKALAAKYNMGEIFFPSFFRQYGFKGTISAADSVYSINALLDSGAQYLLKSQNSERQQFSSAIIDGNNGREEARSVGLVGLSGVGVGTKTGMAAVHHRAGSLILERVQPLDVSSTIDNEIDNELKKLGINNDLLDSEEMTPALKIKIEQRKAWARNFYVAYDALTNYDLLYHGIHLSMMFQKVLMRTGVSIIEKKLTQNLRSFSLTVLHGQDSAGGPSENFDGNEDEFSFFGKNISQLGRLSKFLMGVFKEFKQKDMPLVIAALDDETSRFTVAGFTGTGKGGRIRKNKFPVAFRHAATETGAEVKFDSFEMSVVSVPKDDLSEFLEHLLHFVGEIQ